MPTNYSDDPSLSAPAPIDVTKLKPACSRCRIRPQSKQRYCDECAKEYMKEYGKKRYDERRKLIMDANHNRCGTCGKTQNLKILPKKEFEGDGKRYDKSYTWKKAEFEAAIEKCRLLCYSCHAHEVNGFDLKLEMLRVWGEEKAKDPTQY